MNKEEMNKIMYNKQSACDKATSMASDGVRAKKIIKKTVNRNRNKTNKCSVCKKIMRSDAVKRHMIAKHLEIVNNGQVKKVIWDTRSRKGYHKSVSCGVCGKVTRDDYLKRHIMAKHKDVLNTADAVKKQSNEKMSYNSYERKVTSSTTCAMKTVTNTLHWAFKHIHDETATFLEGEGIADASERTENVLAPVEEKLNDMLEQEINRVANLLILGSSFNVSK